MKRDDCERSPKNDAKSSKQTGETEVRTRLIHAPFNVDCWIDRDPIIFTFLHFQVPSIVRRIKALLAIAEEQTKADIEADRKLDDLFARMEETDAMLSVVFDTLHSENNNWAALLYESYKWNDVQITSPSSPATTNVRISFTNGLSSGFHRIRTWYALDTDVISHQLTTYILACEKASSLCCAIY